MTANIVKPAAHKAVLKGDTSRIVVRKFDSAALKAYNQQAEFQYTEDGSAPSWWTRFWRSFWRWIKQLFAGTDGSRAGLLATILFTFLKILLIAAAVAGIVLFIIKLVGVDIANIFRRKSAQVSVPYSESMENIHQIDFDTHIESAVSSHNYRLAVRLLYLKSLQQLSEASLIQWQPEKSNEAYVNELMDAAQRADFRSLTLQFEYVWYGEFAIDHAIFKRISTAFQKFKVR